MNSINNLSDSGLTHTSPRDSADNKRLRVSVEVEGFVGVMFSLSIPPVSFFSSGFLKPQDCCDGQAQGFVLASQL